MVLLQADVIVRQAGSRHPLDCVDAVPGDGRTDDPAMISPATYSANPLCSRSPAPYVRAWVVLAAEHYFTLGRFQRLVRHRVTGPKNRSCWDQPALVEALPDRSAMFFFEPARVLSLPNLCTTVDHTIARTAVEPVETHNCRRKLANGRPDPSPFAGLTSQPAHIIPPGSPGRDNAPVVDDRRAGSGRGQNDIPAGPASAS
jgi:hypothetical protein